MVRGLIGCSVSLVLLGVRLALADEGSDRIRDNLFILEEGYIEEPGVYHHRTVTNFFPKARRWAFSLIDDFPPLDKWHQFGITLGLEGARDTGTALRDVLLDYRFQAVGGERPVALDPGLSIVLPTGSVSKGTSRGAIGLQFALPVSIEMGRYFVTHLNTGLTWTEGARSPKGRHERALDINAGLALVWQPAYWVNLLVETNYGWTEEVGDDASTHQHSLVISPGVRFAIDPTRTLQIVPGIGAPIQVLPRGERAVGVIVYLSVEHVAFEVKRGE